MLTRDAAAPVICECADAACVRRLPVTPAIYARARSRPEWFLVAPGHGGAPVERGSGWEIVTRSE